MFDCSKVKVNYGSDCEGMTCLVRFVNLCILLWYIFSRKVFKSNIVAAFRGMHVSPAKHSSGGVDRRTDRQTDGRTDGQTDGRTDRQTTDKVIPMCRYASQATQKWYDMFNTDPVIASRCNCPDTVRFTGWPKKWLAISVPSSDLFTFCQILCTSW